MVISYSQLCNIRKIICNYDLMEFGQLGSPPDEYYDLADKIVAEIESPEKECVKKVFWIFLVICMK